jgi:hypothetical protein
VIVGLFENAAELRALGSRPDAGQLTLVALAPDADLAAEQADLDFYAMEDLYDEADLYRATLSNFDHAFELCDMLDAQLENALGAPPPGFTFALLQHDVRCILDRFWHRTWTLIQLVQWLQASQIVSFAPATNGLNPADGALPAASLYSLLTPAVANAFNARFEFMPLAKSADPLDIVRNHPGALASLAMAGRSMYGRARYGVAQQLLNAARWFQAQRTNSDYPTLVTTAGYPGFREIVQAWTAARHGAHLRMVTVPRWASGENGRESEIEHGMADAWPAVADAFRSTGYLKVAAIDLAYLMLPRFSWLWHYRAGDAIRKASSVKPFLERQSKAVVLTQYPVASTELPNMIAARAIGCPVVVYQHGAYGMAVPDRHVHAMEVQPSDSFLVYGSGTVRGLSAGFGSHPRLCQRPLFPVGSIELESIWRTRANTPSPDYDVCYVTTYSVNDNRYMETSHHPPIALSRLERSILRLVADHPQRSALAKTVQLYEHVRFINEVVRCLAATNITVVANGMFSDMVWQGRLIVIESPSTTLLQACATSLPILCLVNLDWVQVDAHWLELLKRRAMVATSVDEFLERLDDVLAGWPPPKTNSVDDSFLLEYGIHRADGRSAERAAAALARVLNEKRSTPAYNLPVRELN